MRVASVFYSILLAVFAMSCSRSITTPPTKKPVDNNPPATYEEDLSLVRPKYEPRPVEEVAVKPVSSYVPTTTPPNDNKSIDEVISQAATRNKAKTTEKGYRIQVFSGNNRTDYEQARGYILQYYPNLETYVTYSQPTYRLKVGDFLNRSDAEHYLASLQSRFVAAKIIYDNVNYQKALIAK